MNEKITTQTSNIVTVTAMDRPARKLILLRSKRSHCYSSFCDEMGCEWSDTLNAIPEKFDTAALLCTWQDTNIKPGTDGGTIAAGVEVPANYDKPLPSGYDIVDLPPCTMLYFQSEPFTNEDDWSAMMSLAWSTMDNYDLAANGWAPAPELAPRFNFGSFPKTGAKNAMPVRKANAKRVCI